jgi:hypothetical protein
VPVRHCYDFSTVAATVAQDLPEKQREEMVAFFVRELQTPTWMRALSDRDTDASFSVRPDHQWTGAYPAWPPNAAAALYAFGRADIASEWLHGLARSANQGPFGQSHFADGVLAPESGGALKAPAELPWINDWTCSSNGAWVSLILGSVFGVQVGSTAASPRRRSCRASTRTPGSSACGCRAGPGTSTAPARTSDRDHPAGRPRGHPPQGGLSPQDVRVVEHGDRWLPALQEAPRHHGRRRGRPVRAGLVDSGRVVALPGKLPAPGGRRPRGAAGVPRPAGPQRRAGLRRGARRWRVPVRGPAASSS